MLAACRASVAVQHDTRNRHPIPKVVLYCDCSPAGEHHSLFIVGPQAAFFHRQNQPGMLCGLFAVVGQFDDLEEHILTPSQCCLVGVAHQVERFFTSTMAGFKLECPTRGCDAALSVHLCLQLVSLHLGSKQAKGNLVVSIFAKHC